MERFDSIVYGERITVLGTKNDTVSAMSVIETLPLTGKEAMDRIIIQDGLKNETCLKKCDVLYAGNVVYPFDEIVNEFKRLMKKGELSGMSVRFYEFLHLNFDIAHYDRRGYIAYYNNSFVELWDRLLSTKLRYSIPAWRSDLRRIADELLKIMGKDNRNGKIHY